MTRLEQTLLILAVVFSPLWIGFLFSQLAATISYENFDVVIVAKYVVIISAITGGIVGLLNKNKGNAYLWLLLGYGIPALTLMLHAIILAIADYPASF
jgi:hypothetical protein